MKRESGAWIAIVCILVVGIFVTKMTSDFVAKGTVGADMVPSAEAALYAEAGSASEGVAADGGAETETAYRRAAGGLSEIYSADQAGESAPQNDAEIRSAADGGNPDPSGILSEKPAVSSIQADQETGEEAAVPQAALIEIEETVAETVKSPLEPGPAARSAGIDVQTAGSLEELDAGEMEDRLDSIAVQISQSRERLEDSTAGSLHMVAQHEWNLWDNELNQIYAVILSRVGDVEAERLRQEELEWIKTRDMAADKAAGKANSQSAQNTSYAEAAAEKTKERCYELVDIYRDILDKQPVK